MFRWSSLLALVVGAVVTLAAGSARADILSDCGGAVFNGNESCTVMASASCDVQCSLPNLEVACSADFEGMCSGGCNATLPSCQGSCEASCMGSCKPGNFNCSADCSGTCEGDCSSSCMGQCSTTDAGADCMGTCQAECKGSCNGRCNASCSGSPADCMGACQASCSGSCSGQANVMCDINCQASLQAMCTAKLQANCTGGCMANTAIFCDGNFINATDANACVNDLKDIFHIMVSGWSYANAGCDGGTCTAAAGAGGQASASCDMAPSNAPPLSAGLIGIGLAASAAGVVRRRRMRK